MRPFRKAAIVACVSMPTERGAKAEQGIRHDARPALLRVIEKVRSQDRRWKISRFQDHHNDYHGALATVREWTDVNAIEQGQVQVTICVHRT